MIALTEHLKAFGSHTLSYSILQDKAAYFQTKDGTLAFFKLPFSTRVAVLGDPLVSDAHLVSFISQFLAQHPGALFYFISKKVKDTLKSFGLKSRLIAFDNRLELTQVAFTWKKANTVKKQSNRAKRSGHYVSEGRFSDFDKALLSRIESAWVLARKNKSFEQCFLTRPVIFEDEEDVRIFFLFNENKDDVLGFLVCLPLYQNGAVSGYYLDALRYVPYSDDSHPYFLLSESIRFLKKEGVKSISLGPHIPHKFEGSFFYSSISFLSNIIYSFRGIETFKKHFNTHKTPLYISYSTVFLLPYLWQGIHLTLQPTLAKRISEKYKSIFSPTTKYN
jgi:lysylphosphatidylglycerol synthetase-like protein (DUF2156 family)